MVKQKQQDLFYKWLGEQIKKARKNSDITQQELAETLGLSRVTVANIEKGKQKIQVHTLIEVANYLKISFNDLYARALDAFNFQSSLETRIIKEINSKDSKSIQNIKNFIADTISKNVNK